VLKSFNGSGCFLSGNLCGSACDRDFKKAPCPTIAVYNSSRKGLYITPTLGTLFTTKPNEMQKAGNACTKFVVPSIGSTIKVGASVRTYVARASN